VNPSDPSQSEFHNEISRIWREIEGLRESVESLRRELTSFHNIMGISPGISPDQYPAEPAPERIEAQCHSYVDLISDITIVRQVLLTQTEQVATIWTIVADPPADDSPDRLTYDDERHTLAILKHNMPLNLEILTISELASTEQLQTEDVKLIWQC